MKEYEPEKIGKRMCELRKFDEKALRDRLLQLNPFGGYELKAIKKHREGYISCILRYEFGIEPVKQFEQEEEDARKIISAVFGGRREY